MTGPFFPNDRNPILTSRHLSYDNWVHSTGHGDLFQLEDGRSYMVCLGIRAEEGEPGMRRSNMGRETYLLPVIWEREPMEWHSLGPEGKRLWPVCAPESGRIERRVPLPMDAPQTQAHNDFKDSFQQASLGPEWLFRRVPKDGSYHLAPGSLTLLASEPLAERKAVSFMGIRQRHSDFDFVVKMLKATEGAEAGVAIVQKDENYVSFTKEAKKLRVCLKEKEKPVVEVATTELDAEEIVFKIESKDHRYVFSYSRDDGKSYVHCTEMAASHLLSLGYTGSCLGLYCTGSGSASFASLQHTAMP